MKKLVALTILMVGFNSAIQAQSSPIVAYATKVADRLKDSLQLTADQRGKVYKLSIQLSIEKMQARQQSSNRDSVGRKLQRIESTRDSLYSTVLSREQFEKYKLRKGSLLNNN